MEFLSVQSVLKGHDDHTDTDPGGLPGSGGGQGEGRGSQWWWEQLERR